MVLKYHATESGQSQNAQRNEQKQKCVYKNIQEPRECILN